MNFLNKLNNKSEIDRAIKTTVDKVLVLRFGKIDDPNCMKQDYILEKTENDLRNMAKIYTVEIGNNEIYTKYFDVTLIPSTIFLQCKTYKG
jgi:hypothetical protein